MNVTTFNQSALLSSIEDYACHLLKDSWHRLNFCGEANISTIEMFKSLLKTHIPDMVYNTIPLEEEEVDALLQRLLLTNCEPTCQDNYILHLQLILDAIINQDGMLILFNAKFKNSFLEPLAPLDNLFDEDSDITFINPLVFEEESIYIMSTYETYKNDEKKTCTVCYEETKICNIKTMCNHFYCNDCILTWCCNHNTCPDCRSNIDSLYHLNPQTFYTDIQQVRGHAKFIF